MMNPKIAICDLLDMKTPFGDYLFVLKPTARIDIRFHIASDATNSNSDDAERTLKEIWSRCAPFTQFREPQDQPLELFTRDAHCLLACVAHCSGPFGFIGSKPGRSGHGLKRNVFIT